MSQLLPLLEGREVEGSSAGISRWSSGSGAAPSW